MAGIDLSKIEGVIQNPVNGLFYDRETGRPYCEDCGVLIPKYREGLNGFVSQDSDKETVTDVGGRLITEKQEKAVCLPCYLDSYARAFPDSPLPTISSELA